MILFIKILIFGGAFCGLVGVFQEIYARGKRELARRELQENNQGPSELDPEDNP